jgi:hypothetical protein
VRARDLRVAPEDIVIRVTAIQGDINVSAEKRRDNVRGAIARGLPQVRGHHGKNAARVCLVGGGPSLAEHESDLRAAFESGAKLVAMNGTYNWLIDHGFRPSAYVQVDARPSNLRFLSTHGKVQGCSYFLASHLDPVFFDTVAGWPNVYIFHAIAGDDQSEFDILNEFYFGRWQPIDGGSTVMLRSLRLFSLLGFKEFELYGCDSCYAGDVHHAYAQPENDADESHVFEIGGRRFMAANWQISQAMEFMELVKARGDEFQLSISGDGLLAHLLRVGAAAYDELTAQQVIGG